MRLKCIYNALNDLSGFCGHCHANHLGLQFEMVYYKPTFRPAHIEIGIFKLVFTSLLDQD